MHYVVCHTNKANLPCSPKILWPHIHTPKNLKTSINKDDSFKLAYPNQKGKEHHYYIEIINHGLTTETAAWSE